MIYFIDWIRERYRDLIEAADAIFEMKTCAKGVSVFDWKFYSIEDLKVEQFVHLLNDKCAKIDQSVSTSSTSANAKSDKQLFKLTLVISVKILTETRRRCWMFLEEKNFAAAARYFSIKFFSFSNK